MSDNVTPFKPPKKKGDPVGYDVDAINAEYALILIGDRALVLREELDAGSSSLGAGSSAARQGYRLLSVDGFRTWTANRLAKIDGDTVPCSKLWLADPRRRQYSGLVFCPPPDEPPDGVYNLWRGFAVEPRPGDCSLYKKHLLENVCRGNPALADWVFGWFAQIVQQPGRRVGTSLVLRGKEGTGKTIVGEIVGRLFPSHYLLVDDPRYVTGQFNAHLTACLLLQADEGFWAGDKAAEGRLKGLVTAREQQIERKGLEPITVANHVRLMVSSNHDWVVPVGLEGRRFTVVDVGDGHMQDREYFGALWRQCGEDPAGQAALLHELLTFDLSRINLGRVEATDALLEQKLASLGDVESWWFECLRRGAIPQGGSDWPTTISTRATMASFRSHAEAVGLKRRAAETQVGLALRKLLKPVEPPPGQVYPWRKREYTEVPVDDGFGGTRMETRRDWVYRLPSLEDCRQAFEVLACQRVSWDEEDEDG